MINDVNGRMLNDYEGGGFSSEKWELP